MVASGVRERWLRITIIPHARVQMRERGISEAQIRAVLEHPYHEYPGDLGRTVAERREGSGRHAIKVVYNLGLEDERIVVTVMRGRPRR